MDVHNHILPGIDDGAKTVEEAISLIKGFSEIGVQRFIATPHIMHNYYPNNPESINASYSLLKEELLKNNLRNIYLEASAEHMIDSDFERILDEKAIMPLKNTYLLVEMSYLQPSINFDTAIQKIASNRYFPIFAHPERYGYLYREFPKYRKYKKQGILYQMNLLSLGTYYGKDVHKTALKLLDEGMIDFVASDVHNQQHLKALKEIKISNKVLDALLPIIEKTISNFY